VQQEKGKETEDQGREKEGGMPQNSGAQAFLLADPVKEIGILNSEVKGPDKTWSRRDHDAERGHGHDQKGGNQRHLKMDGKLDQLDLAKGCDPEQEGIENDQDPSEGVFGHGKTQAEVPHDVDES